MRHMHSYRNSSFTWISQDRDDIQKKIRSRERIQDREGSNCQDEREESACMDM